MAKNTYAQVVSAVTTYDDSQNENKAWAARGAQYDTARSEARAHAEMTRQEIASEEKCPQRERAPGDKLVMNETDFAQTLVPHQSATGAAIVGRLVGDTRDACDGALATKRKRPREKQRARKDLLRKAPRKQLHNGNSKCFRY